MNLRMVILSDIYVVFTVLSFVDQPVSCFLLFSSILVFVDEMLYMFHLFQPKGICSKKYKYIYISVKLAVKQDSYTRILVHIYICNVYQLYRTSTCTQVHIYI